MVKRIEAEKSNVRYLLMVEKNIVYAYILRMEVKEGKASLHVHCIAYLANS